MQSLIYDLRHVLRSLSRSAGFSLLAILTLSLGIGATTSIFSVINGVLLQPLPYPEPDRIVQVFQLDKDSKRMSVSLPNFEDWKAQTRSFEAMAATQVGGMVTVNGLAEPVRARATSVTRDFFSVFGLKPALGRIFVDDELHPGAAPAVIVSDAFWREHLGGTSQALGRTIRIQNTLMTVVGVMPPSMGYPAGVDLWTPQEIEGRGSSRTSHGWRVIARMKSGVSDVQAREDVSMVSRRLKQLYGDQTWMSDGDLAPLRDQIVGKTTATLFVLLAASAFLLLIALGNVVNLLVARMTQRRTEIGLRLALGASRMRLVQQVIMEAGVLSIVGAIGGIALASAGIRVVIAMQAGKLPRANEIHLSWTVLAFALGLAALVAIASGFVAAWQGIRGDIRQTLSASPRTQTGSGSSARVRRALVISELAMSVVLLVGAGLLIRSFVRLLTMDPGYRTANVVVLTAELPWENGGAGAQRRTAFYRDLMERVRALPGVGAVGGISGFPLIGGGADGAFIVLSRIDEQLQMSDFSRLAKDPTRSGYANYFAVDGDYFRAMNIPIVRGRGFMSSDTPESQHVAVVSASLARSKWPNENPIGKIIQYGNMDGDLRPFVVVGVVGDVRDQSLAADPGPTFYAYLPQRRRAAASLHVAIQTSGDPAPVIASTRSFVRELRPDVSPVLRTMETVVTQSVADRRFVLVMVGLFGAAALVLAMLGVYSVISYLVTQRRQEIGVRIALGAQRGDVLTLVLRQGGALALSGIAIGTVAALLLTGLLRGLIYGVSTTDPITFFGVIVLLTAVALIASLVPARRATRVDPMEALRAQ